MTSTSPSTYRSVAHLAENASGYSEILHESKIISQRQYHADVGFVRTFKMSALLSLIYLGTLPILSALHCNKADTPAPPAILTLGTIVTSQYLTPSASPQPHPSITDDKYLTYSHHTVSRASRLAFPSVLLLKIPHDYTRKLNPRWWRIRKEYRSSWKQHSPLGYQSCSARGRYLEKGPT